MREYSIPHLRRSGRISIPEESFDRIREARDLHKEGLGTESVRRILREGSKTEDGELSRRLDHLHETLETLQGSVRERPTTEEAVLPSPTLRTILARQSLLISAVFNLTEMVEELLLASGRPRKVVFGDVEDEIQARSLPTEQSIRRQLDDSPEQERTAARSVPEAPSEASYSGVPARRERFGSLRQRRRRGALAVLSILVVGALLAWAVPSLSGDRASDLSFPGRREAKEGSEGDLSPGESSKVTDGEASGDRADAHDPPADDGAAGTAVGSPTVGSDGAGQAEVPDIANREVEEATRILSRAGLTVAAVKNEASPQEIGTLIGTEPPAGSTVQPGTRVTLVLSGGPDWVPPGDRSVASGPPTRHGD